MRETIEAALTKAGITQKQLASRIHRSRSQTQRLIYGHQSMTPEEANAISRAAHCPGINKVYCRKLCAIGKRYHFDILNNVDLSMTAILTKYRQEEREAHEALEVMLDIVLNKNRAEDCTDQELRDLWHCALEMLDLKHVITMLELRLEDFMDVAALVAEHNRKCMDKHYVDTKKPDLVLVG